MQKRLSTFIFSILLSLCIINCANRGTPSGGPVDEDPPEVVRVVPENYTTNFDADEIRIYFNEFIKLQNSQQQLIISPPMNTPPEIKPLGGASKYVSVKILDTLQPNTTYAINFGNSIVDNNEENPYPFYRYVFSTGDKIDSLDIKGVITDAINRETDDFVSVMLHEVDSTFNDSIVYNQKPKYITNTLDSLTTFRLQNLKEGRYLLTALKENNNNYTFQPKTDKIGFYSEIITVPADSNAVFDIKLFQEELDFKFVRPSHISENKIAFGYEGNPDSVAINVISNVPENFKYKILKDTEKDSLNYWFSPKIEADSLLFVVNKKDYIDTLNVRILKREKDSLSFSNVESSSLKLDQQFKLTATTPIETIDASKISIMDRDSMIISATNTFDAYNNIVCFDFDKKEDNTYRIQMLPGTFTDFFGVENDTLNYTLNTQPLSNFGDVRVQLQNAKYPIIVQLVNDNGDVKAEKYQTEAGTIDFFYLDPGNYYLRVIFDSNGNGKYDTGNYLLKRQPERVSYAKGVIEVFAFAENIETFTLDDEE